MADLEFSFDWAEGDGVKGADLLATWAELRLRVNGKALTTVLDERSRTTRDHVYVPLYPLAEWLATHWWTLLHELETPRRSQEATFAGRHSLRGAREGYALPALSIQSEGERIRLSWEADELPHHRIRFLTSGDEYVSESEWRASTFDFVTAVVRRLRELSVGETLLEAEWEAIQSADAEEQEFCAVTAAFGLDPYTLDDHARETIVTVGEDVPATLRRDFFAVASLGAVHEESGALRNAVETGAGNAADLRGLKDLRESLTGASEEMIAGAPWQTGYALAIRVRKLLELDGQPIASQDAFSRALRADPVELGKAVLETAASPALFDAVVAPNDRGSPGFALAKRHEIAKRFHLCRGICEFLTGGGPALLTRAHSWRQARSRAFAAEFLAPAESLKAGLSGSVAGQDDVDELAGEFAVPRFVVVHQLENHGLTIW